MQKSVFFIDCLNFKKMIYNKIFISPINCERNNFCTTYRIMLYRKSLSISYPYI